MRGGYVGIHKILVLLKDSLDVLPLLPAIRIIELGNEFLCSCNIRQALHDFVQRLSGSSHHSPPLQMLILPQTPRDITFLFPYAEKIELADNQPDFSRPPGIVTYLTDAEDDDESYTED